MKLLMVFLCLFSSAFANSPCGKEGSIEERIKNCNVTKENFALVARDEKGVEIYKDLKSGLLWSDRLPVDFNHYGSARACADDVATLQLLKDVKWRLPTINEFEASSAHGMKEALSRMNYWFWTSTPVKISRRARRRGAAAQSFLWDGVEQKSDVGDLKDAASVRCVAR